MEALLATSTLPVVGTEVVQEIVAPVWVMLVTWILETSMAAGAVPLLSVLNFCMFDCVVCVPAAAFTLT